jgi:hypothetical protein
MECVPDDAYVLEIALLPVQRKPPPLDLLPVSKLSAKYGVPLLGGGGGVGSVVVVGSTTAVTVSAALQHRLATMIIAVPRALARTTPALVTVAIEGLRLVYPIFASLIVSPARFRAVGVI